MKSLFIGLCSVLVLVFCFAGSSFAGGFSFNSQACFGGSCGSGVQLSVPSTSFSIHTGAFNLSTVEVPVVVQQQIPLVVRQQVPVIVNQGHFRSGVNVRVNSGFGGVRINNLGNGTFSDGFINANVSPLRQRLIPQRIITSRPGLFGTRVIRVR